MEVFKELENHGIAVVDGIRSEDDLIALAAELGSIRLNPDGRAVARLRPSRGSKALKGTFSHSYGLSPFPMHTDTAFLSVPVRYVILGMISVSSCSTTYLHFERILRASSTNLMSLAQRAIYLSKTFEECKYLGATFTRNGQVGIRFDSNIMRPANTHARDFHDSAMHLVDSASLGEIDWSGNKAVVLDNWKMLHGRSAALDERRELLRIYVEN